MILIVGGGIGGLSLAACLGHWGIEAQLVERQPTWTTTGGGITLYPNGMRTLAQVGVREEVETGGLELDRIRLLSGSGRLFTEARGEVWEGVGRTFMVDRRVLQGALRSAAGAVSVRLGTTVHDVHPDGAGALVTFTDGTSDHYDLVVGADGIRSTVRHSVFGSPTLRYTGQMYWCTAVAAELTEVATMMFEPGRYAVVFPLGGGTTYVAFQVQSLEPLDRHETDVASLRERFGDFGEPARSALEAVSGTPTLHVGPAEEIETHEWHDGSVVLIGDAAHACSPTMAQGGSLAIEDAVVLAEELAQHSSIDTAIDAFVARRASRVSWVRDRTHVEIEMLNAGATHLDERARETENVLGLPI